jgi:hypothetical protein
MRGTIEFIAKAGADVSENIIRNCWRHADIVEVSGLAMLANASTIAEGN